MTDTHEWIEVGKRRWCIRCNCFQQKARMGAKFWNAPSCDNIYNKDRPRPLSDQFEIALSRDPVSSPGESS